MLRRTKFYRPTAPQDLVIRPRLFEKISQGLSRPLTLVSAPAGYGKTILVSSFLDACVLPWAWLSLDKNDNDLRLFLHYLLTALDTLFPGALRHTQLLLAGPTLPPTALIADNLIDELTRLEREFILVLDDVHEVRNPETYSIFAALLDHPLPGLHLLLVTRQDPPLGLGMLRARDQMTEIRSQDLRFTTAETEAFMAHATATPLPEKVLAILNERTEGWATGLRLAALTLHFGGEIDPKVAELHAANRYVFDYLLHEVLAHAPPAIEDFLVKTSILDTLCGPLCDAVMAADSEAGRGQSYLQMLEETNLFIVTLDEQGFWYRYHHLFQGLLRSRLTRKLDAHAIDALHRRASAWYASHDLPEAALEHALAGHDLASAEQLVAQHRHHLLDTEQRPRLQRWLRAFPEGAVAHSPELLLAKAWSTAPGRTDSHTVMAQVEQAQTLIEQMTDAPERARQLQGEIDTLRSIEKGFAANNPQGVIALTTRALEVVPQEWYWVCSTAWLQLAIAYQLAGQLERAYTVLAAGQLEDTAVIHAPRVRVAGAGALIDWMAGDMSRFIQTSQTVISISQAANLHESLGYGQCFLATAYYQRNNLAAAEQHASIVQAQRYACDPIAVAQSAFILSMVHQARGRHEEARQMLAQVNDYLLEAHSEALLPVAQAFGAELAAMQGDFATAEEWAATVGPLLPFSIMAFFYAPQLALPRILIRLDTPGSRRQAAAALARVEAFVTATHNTRYTIDVLALQALLAAAEGNASAAVQAIEQAVRLAQPGGFIRVFVDLGPAMAALLERLTRRSTVADYIQQLLKAFPATPTAPSQPSAPLQRAAAQTVLVEPLTNRELEVLALLARRLSAREIAQHLVISERTVKRHTANIYQKLAVNNRREAVATAIDLGVFPAAY